MDEVHRESSPPQLKSPDDSLPGQVVLVLQGGGALGSYQAGVYQALHEAGVEPDWIIGTSIGAINASLIAGNAPQNRLPRLEEFWKRMEQRPVWSLPGTFPGFNEKLSYWATVTNGISGFFRPNPLAHAGDDYPLGAERAGYYSTEPLERTLGELVDFELVNHCRPRLTVGAAHVRTSQMRYFDSRDGKLGVQHVMASGALPPAFPAVRIDGELYWDGGILSNTPTEAVFDDNPRRNSLIFAVHMWNPVGAEPTTMAEVLNRHKDVQYSSRIASHIARQQQAHRLRHVINKLAARIPEADRIRAIERFVRLEQSRSLPGSGLGLSLAAAVARLHGGALTLSDNNPGLKSIIALPRDGPLEMRHEPAAHDQQRDQQSADAADQRIVAG